MSTSLLAELINGIENLGLVLPPDTAQRLVDYIELLHRWNRTFNLTAVRQPQQMVSRHLLDSLAVLPHIGEGWVVDVGSGAGLPGIPLALARPQQRFVLIDTNSKKTRFMQQAKIVLGLDNVEVVHSRVQQYQPSRPVDTIIARAYAATDDIIDTTRHLHHGGVRLLVMQGKCDQTLRTAGYCIDAIHRLNVPGLAAERHLLMVRASAPA